MKFHFENQPHQATAIASVVDLFEGALRPPIRNFIGRAPGSEGHARFYIDKPILNDNLKAITTRQSLSDQGGLQLLEVGDLRDEERSFLNFSVEMETGTGKTYVYIATALRLAELYGLRKFVILVHSVAIRAGVVKTFEQTEDHFKVKFPSLPYQWGVLGEGSALDDYREPSNDVQFLIVGVHSIDKPDTSVVYQESEQAQLWGDPMNGISSIAATQPVVIIDEPQNFTTTLRKQAIATLNPLVALRYSATHKEAYNLVHRLGPKAAMEAGLVKHVSVKGIVPGGSNEPYLLVKKLRSIRKRLMAEAVIEVSTRTGIHRRDVVLQNGSSLFEESEGLEPYRGMVVDRFERKPDRVIFEGGREVLIGEETGVNREATWSDQIRHTIRAHLARQSQIDSTGRSVKVLSLFFVERVADYVGLPADSSPVLPDMFDQIFRDEWNRAGLPSDECPDPSTLRVHYFPSTKTGTFKDTRGNASDAEYEARAYEQIVADKEKILTKASPWAFIFSHSALREGWDNPNVFQIGFLRHSRSETERRQQVGRGLRLPVDENGWRVTDPAIARLTLVVDESFAEFRAGLNAEYADARGTDHKSSDTPEIDDVDDEIVAHRRQDKFESTEFTELWKSIHYKASYRVTLDPAILPGAVANSEKLDDVSYLAHRSNVIQTAELIYDEEGQITTADSVVAESRGQSLNVTGKQLPNIVALVEDQLLATKFPLYLTRPTIAAILAELPSSAKRHAFDDPDGWARIIAQAIRTTTIEEMVNHISYEATPDTDWWNAEVVFLEAESFSPSQNSSSTRGIVPSRAGGANLYDHLIFDSDVESRFAEKLENSNENVRLFVKLPRRFKVRTPVGEYAPDWAILYEENDEKRLYLVRETKKTLSLDDLEWDEAMRIRFARRHFEAAPMLKVDYNHTTDHDGLRIAIDIDGVNS